LLPKAIQLEEVKGELEEAIKVYETIVKDFSDEREVAAKALLRMGQCYEKLGKQEAQNAYQRIINEFSDQKNVAEKAQTLLAALKSDSDKSDPSQIVFTRVWSPALGSLMGRPSPDERYISFVNWDTNNLAIHDIKTGKNRDITSDGIFGGEHGYYCPDISIWSRDGKKIAYLWDNSQLGYDLRIINPDGTDRNILYYEKGFWATPLDWSHDGRFILAERGKRGGPHQMVIFSLSDGSFKVLKTLKETGFFGINGTKHNMSFSNDGRYVLYNRSVNKNSYQSDIFLFDLNSGQEITLINHPGNDLIPFWTPDGKGIVFLSDRTGKMGLWQVGVENCKTKGVPQLILRNQEGIIPLELTRNGSLFYGKIFSDVGDVYIASIDLNTGEILTAPEKVSNGYEGHNIKPAWSPDGKYLAFASIRAKRGKNIVIRKVDTGEERVFTNMPILQRGWEMPVWSPDGNSLIVLYRDILKWPQMDIYSIDVQTGEPSLFIKRKEGISFEVQTPPFFSPEGKNLYYGVNSRKSKESTLMEYDLTTGHEKTIVTGFQGCVLSPDGNRLAYTSTDGKTVWFRVVSLSDGEPKQILELKFEEWPKIYTWTPEGKSLLYGKLNGEVTELWKVSAEGGKPVKMELEMKGLNHLSFHPDGRRIVFEVSAEDRQEIWKIENLFSDSN